jgi:PAS domain S-box-containing protein
MIKDQRPKPSIHLIIIFLLLAAGISTAGYSYYKQQESLLRAEAENSISAIADLKVRQILTWRKERISDALVLSENPLVVKAVQTITSGKTEDESKKAILTVMRTLDKHNGYQNVILLDAAGNPVLSSLEDAESIGLYVKQLATEAVGKKQIIFSGLHRGAGGKEIHIDLLAPVFTDKGSPGKASGVFLLRIDPAEFLFPMIQVWPTPSKTAETLLVRRDGNDVIFLNELRHKKDTALNFRIPLNEKNLPAAMAVRGQTGIVQGNDYRNVPVLAALRAVPDMPWFLVSKIDGSEVFAVLRNRTQFIALVVTILILAAGLGVLFFWRHQAAEFYRRQCESEHERKFYAERYEQLTKYANDIILLSEKNGNIVDVNERAVDSYGYAREELKGLNLRDIRSPEAKLLLEDQLKEIEAHHGMIFETQHQRKDGTIFPVEVSSRIIDIGGTQYYQSIVRDITERKKAEERIESEKKFSDSVINSLPGIFYLFDQDGRFIRWNRNFEIVSGYSAEEISNMSPIDLFEGEGKRMVAERIQEVFTKGQSSVEADFLSRDGKKTPYYLTGLRFVMENKTYLAGTGIDISERRQAEELLKASEAELHDSYFAQATINMILSTSFENMPFDEFLQKTLNMVLSVPWISFEPSGSIFLVEDAADILIMKAQLNLPEYLQQSCNRLPYGKCLCGRAALTKELEFADRVDERHDICYDGMPDHGHYAVPILFSNRILGVINIYLPEGHKRNLKDEEFLRAVADTLAAIIVRNHAEEELRKYREGLEELVKERTTELQVLNRELEAFSYSVSHDLRAPLRHLAGFVELFRNRASGNLDEKSSHYLNIIQDAAGQMEHLIDDLLSFSRIGRVEFKKDHVRPGEIISDLIKELEEETRGRKIAWNIHPLPDVYGDRSMLRLVFQNLISNAVKFTEKKEETQIEIGCDSGSPLSPPLEGAFSDEEVFYVRDNGVGFDMQYADKLFNVFQRLHRKEEFEGTGIGLANVRRIVEKHGGRVWAEGEVDKGATFFFTLPKQTIVYKEV